MPYSYSCVRLQIRNFGPFPSADQLPCHGIQLDYKTAAAVASAEFGCDFFLSFYRDIGDRSWILARDIDRPDKEAVYVAVEVVVAAAPADATAPAAAVLKHAQACAMI